MLYHTNMSIESIKDIRDKTDRELVELLQDLVRIPSWFPDDPGEEHLRAVQNENQVVNYLEQWLKENTTLEIERQKLDGGRYNLIAIKGKPDLLFLAHTDTVRPSEDVLYDQFAAKIHDSKIWGRGTVDMKSGIASMIQAIQLSPNIDNFMIVLYADEEYRFLGMRSFIRDYGDVRPKLIVSSDGSDLKFAHGCRGLIEFRARVIGETGHPARGTGQSAILGAFQGLDKLQKYLTSFTHPVMGGTSFNIGGFLGGSKLPDSISQNGILLKTAMPGNVVPDIAEFVVDIRPASTDLTPDKAIQVLKDYFAESGYGFEVISKRHNYGAWYTELEDVKKFIEIAKKVTGNTSIEIENPGKSGYVDLQMIWEKVGTPPAFIFGGGVGDTAHKPNEHIPIENLIKERDFFIKVLQRQNS